MNINVESTTGLERRMTVEIPEERVSTEVDSRLRSMRQTARIPGFRPGKVPIKVVIKRYGKHVREEVVGEIVRSSFMDAVAQEKLRPAVPPAIEPLTAEVGQGISYTAVFEVFPEIAAHAGEGLSIERTRVDISATDVDEMLEKLRSQRRNWADVQRAAAESDRVTVDFDGAIDGVPFDGGKAEDMAVEIGLGRMLPGFEQGLVGAAAGEERDIEMDFPEDYQGKEVAGKHAVFKVSVKKVEEGTLPEIDEDFVKSFGVEDGTPEAFRSEIQNNMQRELNEKLRQQLKQRVMDALLEANQIDIPDGLLTEESEKLMDAKKSEFRYQGIDPEMLGLRAEQFVTDARRRVGLGIILAEVIKENGLQADTDLVRERVESIAASYEEPEEVRRFYFGNRERLAEIESAVIEDQVVAWILDRAKVSDVPSTFDQVMNPMQTSA